MPNFRRIAPLRAFTRRTCVRIDMGLAMVTAPAARAADGPAPTADVQAILDRSCVKCHGPLDQKSGLRLDSAAALWKGNDDGPVAVAGKPDESKLLRVLAADADPHMPPKKQLPAEDVTKVRVWLANAGKATTVSLPSPGRPASGYPDATPLANPSAPRRPGQIRPARRTGSPAPSPTAFRSTAPDTFDMLDGRTTPRSLPRDKSDAKRRGTAATIVD